jgi:hypothetical protein
VRAARSATILLTAHNGRSSAGFIGQGGSLMEAVMSAVGTALTTPVTARRIQLDIVEGDPVPLAKPAGDGTLSDRAANADWQRIYSYRDGLIVERDGAALWLVPMQIVLLSMTGFPSEEGNVRSREILRAAMTRLGLPQRAWRDSTTRIWRFGTSAWVEDAAREEALPLVQGIIPSETVTRDRLMASARAGGEHLLRTLRDDGSWVYTMNPWKGTQSRTQYNVVRHAGTASALFELAAQTGDARYLDGAQRAMAYLATWYRDGSQPGLTYVLDQDGKAKLGSFGLSLLALSRKIELAPQPGDREIAVRIARQIVAMQQPDGAFDSYLRLKGNEPSGSVSLYYPGEAMLGLARLAALGLDEGFLAAAHRGCDFLIAARKGKKPPPDAWLIQALEVLHADAPKPSYVEHGFEIARAMLADQFGPETTAGNRGGFGPEPVSSTRTSARVEGVVSTCRLGQKVGDPRVPDTLAATVRAVPHLFQHQFGPDNSFFLDDPAAVEGGMRAGLGNAEIRIDYVQHHMSAMMGLAGLVP